MTFEWFVTSDEDKYGSLSIKSSNGLFKIWCSKKEAMSIISFTMSNGKKVMEMMGNLEAQLKEGGKAEEVKGK